MAALREAKQLGALADRLDAETPDGQWRNRLVGPPIPNPQKVFGVGLNYLSHADESSMDPPENPLIFTKFPSCLVGAYLRSVESDGCDFEGELVVVIGEPGKDIDRADAWSHVAGLMIGQDISDRPAQFSAKPPHLILVSHLTLSVRAGRTWCLLIASLTLPTSVLKLGSMTNKGKKIHHQSLVQCAVSDCLPVRDHP